MRINVCLLNYHFPISYTLQGDGEDREAKEKATRKMTEEEKAARAAAIERGERVVDYLNSRRMGKGKEYEYEIAWVGQSSRENVWVGRTELIEKYGLAKMIEELDTKIASLRLYRALSKELVISHLKDFGLEEEIAAHNMIRGLSGGQKVKLVLAAAMWCQPHLWCWMSPRTTLTGTPWARWLRAFRNLGVVLS